MAYKFYALIVDDDTLIRKIHDVTLTRCEYNIYVADNGKRAVDLFLAGAQYDIIFMDMKTPIKDGPQISFFCFLVTRELQAMGVNCMIIEVTSHCQYSEKQAGLDDCYEKPLTIDIIKSLLQKLEDRN